MASATRSQSRSERKPANSNAASSGSPAPDNGQGKSPPPVHEIRYRAIAAAIWKNQTDAGETFYSVTVKRGWQDENNQWHDSTSFPFSELPTVAKAISDAHTWIAWTTKRERESAGGSSPAASSR